MYTLIWHNSTTTTNKIQKIKTPKIQPQWRPMQLSRMMFMIHDGFAFTIAIMSTKKLILRDEHEKQDKDFLHCKIMLLFCEIKYVSINNQLSSCSY